MKCWEYSYGNHSVEGARAAPQIALAVVVQVDPRIGGVLLASDDGLGLVVGAGVLSLQVLVHHTGPQQRLALAGLHCRWK